jgi:hypothetical protein
MNPKHRILKIGTVTVRHDGSLAPDGWAMNGENSDAAGFDSDANGIVLMGGWTMLELKAVADEAQKEQP